MRKKPGPKPKEDKPPIRKSAVEKPLGGAFKVVEEASMELEAAIEAFDDEEADNDDHAFAMERLQRASGLLRGMVLILKDNGGKL